MRSVPRLRATSLLLVVVIAAAACSPVKDATGWDDPKAKAHFLASCQGDTEVGNTTTTVVALGSKSFCTCVFEDLTTKHKLSWDALLEYEKKQASAKAGELPDPPSQVTKAIEACSSADAAGPTAG